MYTVFGFYKFKQLKKISKLKDKIRHIIEVDDIKLPSERHIFKQQFKGISAKTMMEFNAFTTQHLQLQNYICIPVYQFGKLKFIEGRKFKDNNHQPKYYRRPANAKTNNILFPLDKINFRSDNPLSFENNAISGSCQIPSSFPLVASLST